MTWQYADGGSDRSPATSFTVNAFRVIASLPAPARSARLRVLSSGPGTVVVQAHGVTGTSSTGTEFDFPLPDLTPPTVALSPVPGTLLGTGLTLRHTGVDDRRIVSYDVRARSAPGGRPLGAWTYPAALQRRTSRSTPVSGLALGSTWCWSARSRDGGGNISPWSRATCTTVAADDRVLRADTGWVRGSGAAYYRGTVLGTTRSGARASLAGTRAAGLTLVVTRCPTCGRLGVYDDGALVATVDLRRSTTARRSLVRVPFDGPRSGVLSLRVLSAGRLVQVDGLALRAY